MADVTILEISRTLTAPDLDDSLEVQSAANGIEPVAEARGRRPNPLLGSLADALGGTAIVQDVRNRGL